MSFASELNDKGDYDEAIEAATKAMADDAKNPEAFLDRAVAHDGLERYAEAAADFERAIALNAEARVLDKDNLDDAFFSALVAAARGEAETSVPAAARRLARYAEVLPGGRHVQDADDWRKRLRGEMPSLLDKRDG